jgi:hypothetical protein
MAIPTLDPEDVEVESSVEDADDWLDVFGGPAVMVVAGDGEMMVEFDGDGPTEDVAFVAFVALVELGDGGGVVVVLDDFVGKGVDVAVVEFTGVCEGLLVGVETGFNGGFGVSVGSTGTGGAVGS